MGFRVGAYATVFDKEIKSDKVTRLRLAISKKNKDTGDYETDWSGFASVVGTMAKEAANLTPQKDGQKGSRIKLGDVDVTNTYDKEKKTTYTNYTIWSFENTEGGNAKQTNTAKKAADPVDVAVEEAEENNLPF